MILLKHVNEKIVNEVWHYDYFELCKFRISDNAYKKMIDEINKVIDENLKEKSKIVVKKLVPKRVWINTTWDEAYTKACSHDDCYSAQFIGLLMCQELIKREETWYFLKKDLATNMVYFTK